MSMFFDREAILSEGSEDEEVREDIRRHQQKHGKKKKRQESDDEDEEEEEDDDEAIANEMKDLINDDIEEEEEDSEDDIGRGNKRSIEEEDSEGDLEDDDYDLIEENLGTKIKRDKKYRRIQIADDDDDERGNVINDREAIANELFDDDDDTHHIQRERVVNREQPEDRFGAIDSEHSESEDDFIDDDDDNRPASQRPRARKGGKYADRALQQAQDIFGVDFDFDEIAKYDGEEDYEDEELEDEEYAAEGMEERVRLGTKKRKRRPKKSIFELYEPAELERSHLTEVDNEIRNTDLPERFQLRSIPITRCDDNEIRDEAEWIFKNLYEMPTITKQDKTSGIRQPMGGSKPRSVVMNIREVLHFLRNHLLEVPFIAYYRKEYYSPELSINDLWLIYRWDEKWCQLQERKKNLQKLLENMKEYQLSIMLKNQDQPLPDHFRRVTERDIKRIQSIQSFEEFNDYYLQFQLYYSTELTEMKKFLIEQKRQERERKKLRQQQMNENEDGENPENEAEKNEEDDVDNEEYELTERMNFIRLSQKRDTYFICREFGIGKLAAKFGLTPEQFGEHISESYHKHEIEQHESEPLEAAKELVCKRFDTPEKVLQASTFMVGKQLSCDPLVRKTVRQVFYERAKVTAKPTKKGQKEIDEAHPCYAIKYLKNKPISSFTGDQFLQLNIAKTEGLVEVNIFIDEPDPTGREPSSSSQSQYLDEIKYLYHRDEFSKNVQDWNEQRTLALDIALNRLLFPYFIKELSAKALAEAQFTITQACAEKLASYISVAPYVSNISNEDTEMDEDFDTRNGLRVMGFAFTPDNEEASYCALIDGDAEVTDYLKLEHFMLKRSGGFVSEKEKSLRNSDKGKLQKFILQKKPHVIALGCDTLVTKDVMAELTTIVRELHDIEEYPLIPIEYVDSELSVIFMDSKRANADFHNYPLKLRQAISLARRLQDPLVEFSQLCSADEEILCLKLHPLQDNVPREPLLNALYAEFVNQVNEVGVDVNKCLVHPYTSPLVQFIGGLGPRKGSYLLRTLKRQPTPLLESRTQLVQNCNIGKVVFINCAGFIKIDTNAFADSGTDTYIEVLDSTRVHPEAYEWARKMAVDALDYDEDNDHNPAQALEEIIENPEKLRDLDLDEFAKELKRQGLGLKKQTLYDIRNELTDRYQDKRKPYRPPTKEEIFQLLTGENLETLHVGKLVQVRVTGIVRRKPKPEREEHVDPVRTESGGWKCPFCLKDEFMELGEVWSHFDQDQCAGKSIGVRVRLDNGLNGMIQLKYLSDKEVLDPFTRVKVGMTINCRIMKVLVDKFSLDLTCRTSDLIDANNRFKLPKDSYYDFESEERDSRSEEEKKKKKRNQRTFMKRIIVHPSFHNIDFKKSEQILAESPQGEAVIRPSSKGNDHLTLSWKVHDGIHQHVLIREEKKTNAFSLGRQLFINNESFEDLDEIIARFVQPMAGYARDLINFKYFRSDLNGDRAAIESALAEEKQKAPSRIPYIISASKEFPGKFLLSYQPNQKAFHELITVSPEGFKYRNNVFKSVNALFKWFKCHFNDPNTFPRTPGPQTPMGTSPFLAQRTPIAQNSPYHRSPSVGSSKGGFVPTPNINPQVIQRAAATMPNHLFNTLSQVTGQQATNFNGAPVAGYNMAARPQLFQAPAPNMMSMVPPNTALPPPAAPLIMGIKPGRPNSRSGMQWSEMIQQEQLQQGRSHGMPVKPRTPVYSTPGASSQMSISPLPEETPNIKGDQTPLVDEWN